MIRSSLISVVCLTSLLAACGPKVQPPGQSIDPQTTGTEQRDSAEQTGDPLSLAVIPSESPESEDLFDPFGSFEPVFFSFDRSDIRADQEPVLQKNANRLLASGVQVVIQGHCDERGTEEYNLALGDRRARAVRDYLVALGVSE